MSRAARLSRALRLAPGEWRWPAAVAAAVMGCTLLPYLLGWLLTPPGHVYGGWLASPDEHNVYLSWIRQARDGHPVFYNLFTTEPQKPYFFNLYLLVLGLVARLPGVSLLGVYYAARIVLGWLMLMAVYLLAAHCHPALHVRRLAVAFTALASGLGWLFSLLAPAGWSGATPIDYGSRLVMPEAIGFLSLLLNPLFCLSIALLVVIFLGANLAFERRSWRWALVAGGAALVLGNVHTYDLVTVWGVLFVALVVRGLAQRRFPTAEIGLAAIIGVLSLPFGFAQYWVYRTNPLVYARVGSPTATPAVWAVLLGFGLPLALAGGWRTRRSPGMRFPLVWLLTGLALVYLPAPFQRKLAEGLWAPISILAAAFVGETIWARWRGRTAVWVAAAVVAICAPSNAFFLVSQVNQFTSGDRYFERILMPPLYLTDAQVAGARWLDEHAPFRAAVLSDSRIGNYLPRLAGVTVYVGHWDETKDFEGKLRRLLEFYAAATPDIERARLLRAENTRFLWHVEYGPGEVPLGPHEPARSSLFRPVFQRGDVTIYRVVLR